MLAIPSEVKKIMDSLACSGYEAHIVGGCVRDLIMGETPTDWDITTNAKPEEIQKLFADSFYENEFGTVGVKTQKDADLTRKDAEEIDKSLAVIEVTTYRLESGYSDKRHPDEVKFARTLGEDLQRRDFTINAIAMGAKGEIMDPYGGRDDIAGKTIRAVGNPEDRFGEDALRMMRAVRFASTLGFVIEEKTHAAIHALRDHLKHISQERVRDELIKLINGGHADKGVELLRETELLKYVLPELLEGVDVEQNLHHIYSVWEHNIRALRYTCEQNYSLEVRLAALLHDVGKPRSKRGEGRNSTFYGHEVSGARVAPAALSRLKFSKEQIEKITKLVRYHLFYYNPGEVTESSVRRLVANIGKENTEDLLKVREADRIGSGTPKAIPYKLRHLKFMIDKVARDPISPKMLKINGNDIMKLLGIEPGPKVGMIMNALMEEVLDDPSKNSSEYLEERTRQLGALDAAQLARLSQQGKEKTKSAEEEEIGEIKHKHHVQ